MKLIKNTEWKTVEVNGDDVEIPMDWEVEKFKNFGNFKSGKSHKKAGMGNIRVFGSSIVPMKQKVANVIYKSPTFIIGRKGTIDKPFKVDGDFWCVDTALYFDFKKENLRDFIFYIVKKINWFDYNRGTGVPGLIQNELNEIEFISPKTQQSSIASILSKQEQLISDTESLISKLEKRMRWFSNELLSGRLRVKEVNGKTVLYKNTEWKTVEVNGEDIEIPVDWEVEKIGQNIEDNKKAKTKAKSLLKFGKYPAFNCSAKQLYFADSYLVDGENLFFSTGGKSAIHYYNGKANYSSDVYSVKTKERVFAKYIYYYFQNNSNLLLGCFEGGGLKHLNKTDMKDIDLVFPEVGQIEIINMMDKQEEQIEQYKHWLKKEQQKFKWLMNNLLSGKYLVKM